MFISVSWVGVFKVNFIWDGGVGGCSNHKQKFGILRVLVVAHYLTLKVPITTAADDIHFFIVLQRK